MKNKWLSMLAILMGLFMYSQEGVHESSLSSPIPENFISASPDVMAFQKYNSLPVNLYTGKIDLSIPIFEIQSGGITVPISISYNSGGIKVDDYASSVGLGWNLNAGGSIIRSIKDLPDNEVGFSLFSESDWDVGTIINPWLASLGYNRRENCVDSYQNSFLFSSISGYKHATYVENPNSTLSANPNLDLPTGGNHPGYGRHIQDMSPDIFMASAPGLSSNFTVINTDYCITSNSDAYTTTFLNNDGSKMDNVVVEKNDSIDGLGFITINSNSNHSGRIGFPITDFFEFNLISSNGVKYKFSDEEVSENFYYPHEIFNSGGAYSYLGTWNTMINGNYSKRINAWNITQIEDPTSDRVVNFVYDTYANNNVQRNTFINANTVVNSGSLPSSNECWFVNNSNGRTAVGGYDNTFKSLQRHIQRKRITKITFDQGEIEFIYGINRDDYLGEKALTEIRVIDFNGIIIKRVKFNYSYFISKENCTDEECKRLRLDSVDFYSGDNTKLNDYVFDYYYDNKLPKRGSLEQDFLGFYNANGVLGQSDENTTIKPKLYFYDNEGVYSVLPFQRTGVSSVLIPGDIDFTPNSNSITALLKKVTYPTGGSSEFIYENNSFNFEGEEYTSGGARIKTQILKESGTIVKTINYEYQESDGSTSGYINNIPVYGYVQHFQRTPFSAYQFEVYDKPKGGLELTSGSYVGYSEVKVYETGNGYTKQYFHSPLSQPNMPEVRIATTGGVTPPIPNSYDCSSKYISNGAYPSAVYVDNDYKRGKLKKKEVFDESNTLLIKEEFTYSPRTLSTINLQRDFKIQGSQTPDAADAWDEGSQHILDVSSTLNVSQDLMTYKLLTEYLDANSKTTEEYYTYDSQYPYLKEQRLVSGTTTDTKKITYYPYETSVSTLPYMTDLVNENRLFTAVKEEIFEDTDLLVTNQTSYKSFTNGIILPESLSTAKGQEQLIEGAIITIRDSHGNIVEYTTKDKVNHFIIWGYNYSQPIAVINDATKAQVETWYSTLSTLVSYSNTGTYNKATLIAELKRLHIAVSPHAEITTYVYEPLIGLTQSMDSRGYVTYYEYDEFNRLKEVKDADGNILSHNKYHYKGTTN